MGLWDRLGQVGSYVRKLRLSLGPDSYFQYRRGREYERKRADDERAQATVSAERKRGEAERGRQYDERYAGERERDVARERSERAKEGEPDRRWPNRGDG
jgi:hypothetical protein